MGSVRRGCEEHCHPERSEGSQTQAVLLRSLILFSAIIAIKALDSVKDQVKDQVKDSVRDWVLDSALVLR